MACLRPVVGDGGGAAKPRQLRTPWARSRTTSTRSSRWIALQFGSFCCEQSSRRPLAARSFASTRSDGWAGRCVQLAPNSAPSASSGVVSELASKRLCCSETAGGFPWTTLSSVCHCGAPPPSPALPQPFQKLCVMAEVGAGFSVLFCQDVQAFVLTLAPRTFLSEFVRQAT